MPSSRKMPVQLERVILLMSIHWVICLGICLFRPWHMQLLPPTEATIRAAFPLYEFFLAVLLWPLLYLMIRKKHSRTWHTMLTCFGIVFGISLIGWIASYDITATSTRVTHTVSASNELGEDTIRQLVLMLVLNCLCVIPSFILTMNSNVVSWLLRRAKTAGSSHSSHSHAHSHSHSHSRSHSQMSLPR